MTFLNATGGNRWTNISRKVVSDVLVVQCDDVLNATGGYRLTNMSSKVVSVVVFVHVTTFLMLQVGVVGQT